MRGHQSMRSQCHVYQVVEDDPRSLVLSCRRHRQGSPPRQPRDAGLLGQGLCRGNRQSILPSSHRVQCRLLDRDRCGVSAAGRWRKTGWGVLDQASLDRQPQQRALAAIYRLHGHIRSESHARRDPLLLELLAVDQTYNDQGVGKRLVRRACEVADEARLPMILQSGSAKDYYLRLGMGFGVEAEPDWDGYNACIIVRPSAETVDSRM